MTRGRTEPEAPQTVNTRYEIERELTMLRFLAFAFGAVFSLLALVSIALFVRELVARMTAGPVRFRLAIASAAAPWPVASSFADPLRGLRLRGVAAYGWVRMFLLLTFLSIGLSLESTEQLIMGSRLMLIIALFQCFVSFRMARRDAKWWLVLASGLFSLATGAVILAVKSRALQEAGDSWAYKAPDALLLVASALLCAIGAAVIHDSILGTRVRERGIELFCTSQPWSRIVVKDWLARDGAFALRLTILPPRLFGVQLEIQNEIAIPVSAAQRPELEDFLDSHAAIKR
jgi:hypothetical protein